MASVQFRVEADKSSLLDKKHKEARVETLHRKKRIAEIFSASVWPHIGTSCQKQWSWLSGSVFSRTALIDVESEWGT